MMTSSNENIIRVAGPSLGESTGHWSPKGQWRGGLKFFFDLRLDKGLSKKWRRRWFETPSRPLWRHRNVEFESWSMFYLYTTSCHIWACSINVTQITFWTNEYQVVNAYMRHRGLNELISAVYLYPSTDKTKWKIPLCLPTKAWRPVFILHMF